MPRSTPLVPPSPGDADRKRVLNVLAQRRYRQRKKERYAALEARAKSGSAESSTSPESSSESSTLEGLSASTSSGVSLPEYQDNIVYTEPMVDTDKDPFNLEALLDPPNLEDPSGSFGFQNDMAPSIEESYAFSNTPPSVSMDMALDIPLLKLIRACTCIAQILGCENMLWDPTSRWTYPQTQNILMLPDNMQPTQAQLTISHHPLLDLLPWPQLRTKLICIFSLPPEQRPSTARDPMALMQLAFDIDDETEGFRVNGEGVLGNDWEIGEAFFRNWWWSLDRSIVETSNAWRQKRGQRRLAIPSM